MRVFVEGFYPNVRFLEPNGSVSSDALHFWKEMEVESVTRNLRTSKETYGLREGGGRIAAEEALSRPPVGSLHVTTLDVWIMQRDLHRPKVFDSGWAGPDLWRVQSMLGIPEWADVVAHFRGDREVLPRIAARYKEVNG